MGTAFGIFYSVWRARLLFVEKTVNRLSAVLQSIGEGVIATDMSGLVTEINPVAERLTGWLDGSAIGKNIDLVFNISKKDGSIVDNSMKKVVSDGRAVEIYDDIMLVGKGGGSVQIAYTATSILLETGELSGVVLVFKDVSQSNIIKESLELKLSFHKLMAHWLSRFTTMPDDDLGSSLGGALSQMGALFEVDRCSVFLTERDDLKLYRQWCKEGVAPVGHCPADICPCLREGEIIRDGCQSFLPDGAIATLCVPMIGKASLPVGILRFDSTRPKDWDEDHVSLISMAADMIGGIILKRKTEESLKESEQRLSNMVDDSFNSIAVHRLVLDDGRKPVDYVFLRANPAFYVHTGLRAEDVLGRPVTEVLPGIEDTGLIQRYGEVVLTGKPASFEYYSPFLKKHYAINAHRVAGMEFATIFQDISDQKELKKSLLKVRLASEEADKAKREFLANMSHEIRTPLNGVIGMAHLLWDSDLTEEQRDYVRTIAFSGEALLEIINQILDFSRIDTGNLSLESSSFDVGFLVEETLDLVGHQAKEKGLELMGGVSPEVPMLLEGDPGRIRQILMNLLSNAIKFTKDGYVSLIVTSDGSHDDFESVRFEVSDTGIGIPKEKLTEIFNPFTQADPSATRCFGGTGLGLAVSKKLVDLMGGSLEVDTEEGSGSVFSMVLPMKLVKEGTAPSWSVGVKLADSLPTRKGVSPKILVVEDTVTNRKVIVRLLEKLGYRSDTAANGKEALLALSMTSYDGVLMDIQMPEMDGLEATRRIREREKRSSTHIPIVALTAHVTQEHRDRCMAAGMDGYLSKPVRINQLAEALEMMVPSEKIDENKVLLPSLTSDDPIARDELMDLIGGDLEILARLISAFEADFPRLSDLVSVAIVNEDWDEASKGASRMKVILSSLAAWEARETASLLEESVRCKEKDIAYSLFKKLRQEAAKVLESLYSIREQIANSL